MKTTQRWILVLLTIFGVMGGAQAQQNQWFLGMGSGTSQTASSTIHLEQDNQSTNADIHGVRWGLAPFVGAPYFHCRVGFWSGAHPNFGAMIDYTHNKAVAATGRTVTYNGQWQGKPLDAVTEPLENRVGVFRLTNGVNIWSINLMYRVPVNRQWRPYIGAGPSLYYVWARTEVNGRERYSGYRRAGFGWEGRVGVAYQFASGYDFFLDGKYTYLGSANVAIDGGTAITRLRTGHAQFGISHAF